MKKANRKPEGVYVGDLKRAGGNMQGIRSSNCGSTTTGDAGFIPDELEIEYCETLLINGVLDELYFQQ